MPLRHRVLPSAGVLLVNTDLHGNADDFAKLEEVFRSEVGSHKTEQGFFYEGGNQLCPCIFGAPRREKRYVRLDLGARYERAEDLRDGFEIRRLWG